MSIILDMPCQMVCYTIHVNNNQLVFNSFPRTANVYLMHICEAFFPSTETLSIVTAVHMPQVYFVKELDNVALFRKPEDAISSLVYYQYSQYAKMNEDHLMNDVLIGMTINAAKSYKTFIKYAIESADLIYISRFDDFIKDPVGHFENIAKKFNKNLFPDYKKKFIEVNSKLVGNLWENDPMGHLPRKKSDQRKYTDELVKSLPFIQELNQEYEEFILKYKTIV